MSAVPGRPPIQGGACCLRPALGCQCQRRHEDSRRRALQGLEGALCLASPPPAAVAAAVAIAVAAAAAVAVAAAAMSVAVAVTAAAVTVAVAATIAAAATAITLPGARCHRAGQQAVHTDSI
jgi:hypothetical protein